MTPGGSGRPTRLEAYQRSGEPSLRRVTAKVCRIEAYRSMISDGDDWRGLKPSGPQPSSVRGGRPIEGRPALPSSFDPSRSTSLSDGGSPIAYRELAIDVTGLLLYRAGRHVQALGNLNVGVTGRQPQEN